MDELDCRSCKAKKYCGTVVGEIKLCHSLHPEYWEKKNFKEVDTFIAEEMEKEDTTLREIFESMQADYAY